MQVLLQLVPASLTGVCGKQMVSDRTGPSALIGWIAEIVSLVMLDCKDAESQGFQEQECVLFPFFKMAPAQNTDPNMSIKWCF